MPAGAGSRLRRHTHTLIDMRADRRWLPRSSHRRAVIGLNVSVSLVVAKIYPGGIANRCGYQDHLSERMNSGTM